MSKKNNNNNNNQPVGGGYEGVVWRAGAGAGAVAFPVVGTVGP